ncbi:MAG: DUF1573 domain-containing protein [Desulfobacteraceae bacterium]|nr:DUF1573 domain-containing protein [Desulfobacteraceae bacterium]
MKYKSKIQLIAFVVFTVLFCLASQVMAVPKAVPMGGRFQFEPVPEGQKVSHEYVIKNDGDSVLKIVKVSPP